MSPPIRTKVFVISLRSAEDRRERFAHRAEPATLEYSFFDARQTLHTKLSYEPSAVRVSYGRELRQGELGCYSSHFALWDQLVEDDEADQYIVLEDDIIADWKRLAAIARYDFSVDGVSFVRLYQKRPTEFIVTKRRYILPSFCLVQNLGFAYGTQGYVITKHGASLLMNACRTVRRPIDDEMDRFWAHGIPNLALFPFPIIEEDVSSSIGDFRRQEKQAASLQRRAFKILDGLRRRKAVLLEKFKRRAA